MKSLGLTSFGIVTMFLAIAISPAVAAIDWIVDIQPAAILANMKADAFTVTGPAGRETVSLVTTMPSISGGISFERRQGYVDLKGGGGLLLNSRLHSFMFFGSAALHHEIKPSIMVGPHAVMGYATAPQWWGDADVEFSGSMTWMIGLHVAAGDKIAYLLSIDYFSASFDVASMSDVWSTTDDPLDMSGIAVQFGIRAQF